MVPLHYCGSSQFHLEGFALPLRDARIHRKHISEFITGEVRLRGWVYRLRILDKTAFVVVRDCSGEARCVAAPEVPREHKLKDVIDPPSRIRDTSLMFVKQRARPAGSSV
jgi:aspartyl/asparaginyl-tRNA synthetase